MKISYGQTFLGIEFKQFKVEVCVAQGFYIVELEGDLIFYKISITTNLQYITHIIALGPIIGKIWCADRRHQNSQQSNLKLVQQNPDLEVD